MASWKPCPMCNTLTGVLAPNGFCYDGGCALKMEVAEELDRHLSWEAERAEEEARAAKGGE